MKNGLVLTAVCTLLDRGKASAISLCPVEFAPSMNELDFVHGVSVHVSTALQYSEPTSAHLIATLHMVSQNGISLTF